MQNGQRKSSRYLNEKSTWFGLGVFDLAGLGYFLILTFELLERWNLGFASFIFTAILAFSLIQVRLSQRPKCIRDFIQFQFKRTLQWI